MDLQKCLSFPVKKFKPRTTSKKLNSENSAKSAKRVLFGNPDVSPLKKQCPTFENRKKPENVKGFRNFSFETAKQVFHSSQPSRIISRDKEIFEIEKFLCECMENNISGSMYLCGAPGTGKTSTLFSVIDKWKINMPCAFVNCMTVNNVYDIFKLIAKEFNVPTAIANSKNLMKSLEGYFTKNNKMNILILDEIDHLDSKDHKILYSLFEWPHLKKSSLILIGIANALDLTERLLPRLQTFECAPKVIHFQPYSKEQIVMILQDRLSDLSSNSLIIKPSALELCARKISACTGDIRKALDVCRRAIEFVQNKKRSFTLQPTSDDRCNPGSPMKKVCQMFVDLPEISAVLHEVYGSRLQTSNPTKKVTLPLQQMVVLCTLVLMKKHCKLQEINLGKLYSVYKRVCKKREINSIGECELTSLCRLIEARGFIQLKSAKIARMSKIVLKVDEGETEFVLQDKTMLSAILSDLSVLSNS